VLLPPPQPAASAATITASAIPMSAFMSSPPSLTTAAYGTLGKPGCRALRG